MLQISNLKWFANLVFKTQFSTINEYYEQLTFFFSWVHACLHVSLSSRARIAWVSKNTWHRMSNVPHYFMPGFFNAWWSQSTRGPKHLFLRTLSPNLNAISLFLARAVCTFPLQVLHKRRSSKKHEHAISFPFSHLSYLLYQCYSLVSKATTLMMISLFLGRWNVSILMQDSFKLTSTL